MTWLIHLIHTIPNVVWSGVIASVLTLSGVLISNRSNTNRLRIQLQHDADEKAKERISILRRDVYLRTVEELTRANNHLMSLTQCDLTKTNSAAGLNGFFAEAAKLQLIAEPKTALLVNKLVATYNDLFLRIMPGLLPLQEARTQISIHENLFNKVQDDVSRVLSEMARLNESGQVNPGTFAALQRSFDSYQVQAQTYADAQNSAWKDFNRLAIEFNRQLLVDMQKIGEQQIPAMIEIRRDLGLTAELDAFRKQMDEQRATTVAKFDEAIDILRRREQGI